MPALYPSAWNTRLPNHEASGKLIIDFSRNAKKYALANYCQYVPTKKTGDGKKRENQGYYVKMTAEECARVIDATGGDAAWPDGAPRPSGKIAEQFDFVPFRTHRFERGFNLGEDTVDLASWDVVSQYNQIAINQLMTLRTLKAVTLLTTTGNYAAAHTQGVAAMQIDGVAVGNAGTWAASTSARQDIKRSLMRAGEFLNRETLGVVDVSDLHLVISPKDAAIIAETQEIVEMLKGSPLAMAYVKGELKDGNRNAIYGLPPTLYGVQLDVEDCVRISTKKGATATKSRVWPSGSAVLCARPGSIEGTYGGPSFSTLTAFMREEMTVEGKADAWNRMEQGSVVDDYELVLTAPVAAFLFTGIV